jgi:F-type H+-transporting ATPase subunit b
MKKFIRTLYAISAAALFLAAFALPVLAAEHGGGEHEGSPVMDYVWKVVNFAILVFILVKFAGKPLAGVLKARTEGIKKSIDDAREARELAERALAEVESRARGRDKEIEEMVAAAKASGERERERLIQEAEKMSEKLVEQARANIEYELKQAQEAIKAEAVQIAMELAEKKIKDKLTEADRKRLFEESLAKLEAGR